MRKRLSSVWPSLIVALGPIAGTAVAADAPVATPEPTSVPLTADDVGAWLDGFMPAVLARGGIAGAVVVVVKDGSVLFEKGYGFSDVAARKPVDPKTTLFRPGSISKLFAWTAVMQQVEAGRLDLDADVNRYLDFKIPPRNGLPITLRNCMTHTPGFEEFFRGYFIHKPTGLSLVEELKDWLPARVFDPGTTPAYSNYGALLAGYIVERVSGERFETYVENHIFRPLGMQHSTFEQPLPERLAPFMSKGYPDASKPAAAFEYIAAPAAGGLSASGDDMGRFMIAHLQDGRLGDARILKPETARLMHDTRTSLMAPLEGIELGFYDQDINGHRVIAHDGDLRFFHSGLSLFIEDGVGLYVSLNSAGVPGGLDPVRGMLFEGFADRYFPAVAHDGVVDDRTAAEHAELAAGHYLSARGSYSNFLATLGLFSQLSVVANADDTISVSILNDPSGMPRKYREIAPFLWREVGGHDRVGALVRGGRVVRVSSDLLSGVMVYDRAPALLSAGWISPAAVASLTVVLLTALAWPVGALVRRRYHAPFPLAGARATALRGARVGALALLVAVAGWGGLATIFAGMPDVYTMPWLNGLILALEALTLLATLGATAAAACQLVTVWKGPSGWFGKFWSVLLAVACLVILWIAYQGNLMNFSTRY